MEFTVRYRNENGTISEMVVDADSKSKVFGILREKGISAVSVTEGSQKRTSYRNPKNFRVRSHAGRLLVSITAVVFVTVVGWFVLAPITEKSEAKEDSASTNTGKIKDVKPSIPVSKPVKLEVASKKKKVPYWELPTTNGLSEAQIRKWKHRRVPPPSYTNNAMRLRAKAEFEIFGTRAENEIAMLLTIEPGQGLVGSPNYGEQFRNEFMKSCETPIIINPEDSDYVKQLKKDMIATKIDLRQRMADGEDICKIMSDSHEEAMRLGLVKQEIEGHMRELLNSAKTPEELEDSINAANLLLEQKGIAPIKISPIMKRNLLRKMSSQIK
jgi:hypothetical protein